MKEPDTKRQPDTGVEQAPLNREEAIKQPTLLAATYHINPKHTHPAISILPKVYIIGEHFSEKMFWSAHP